MRRFGSRASAALVLAALLCGAGAAAAAVRWQRVRHLAVPTFDDPSLAPAAAPLPIETTAACAVEPLARLPGRVSALLEAGSTLWAAGFDTGVYRLDPREGRLVPVAVLGVAGRERFVNALAAHEGRFFAATYAGILELDPQGRLAHRHLPGIAVEALLATGGELLAGTTAGLFRLGGEGFEPVRLASAEGATIRVTALARAGGRLWLGSPSGVLSAPAAALEAGRAVEATWHPLVFGERAARTNVVLALLPWGEGVLAGTDDGGLVEVALDATRAFESPEPRANEVNPGAGLLLGARALFGTQGAGLLAVGRRGGELFASRPLGWPIAQVSAVASAQGGMLVGGEDGVIARVRCPP